MSVKLLWFSVVLCGYTIWKDVTLGLWGKSQPVFVYVDIGDLASMLLIIERLVLMKA